MENSLKGLILAAGTIITCVVISLGFLFPEKRRIQLLMVQIRLTN